MATLLDSAGLSARELADNLDHEHASMTQDVYASRRTVSERAAELPVVGKQRETERGRRGIEQDSTEDEGP